MARNGATTAVAEEPNELYDQLSLDERDCFDRIASTGYKPFVSGSRWNATNGGDGPRIGPFPNLAELEEAVLKHVTVDSVAQNETSDEAENQATDEEFTLSGEAPEEKPKVHKVRQPLLPNTENMVLQNMREALLSYRATTMDILELQERQKEEKKLAKALMHKFEDELSVDKETGFKFYMVETIKFVLETKVTEELKTEKVSH
jgi:hypothetical protein